MSAMVWCTALYLSTGKVNNDLSAHLLPPEDFDEDNHLQSGTQAKKESYFQLSDLPQLSLKLRTALALLLCALITCFLLSIISFNFSDWGLLTISVLAGCLFGLFLLNKVQLVLTGKSENLLGKDDYIIGYLKLVYLDSAFVLLVLLIVMLCMIEDFTEQ